MAQNANHRSTRDTIIWNFAVWVAGSAARQGALTRGHGWDQPLAGVRGQFDELLMKARPNQEWFEKWHKRTVDKLMGELKNHDARHEKSYGWIAKIVNMITKVQVYIGGCGDPDLKRFIHPPVDHFLIKGLSDERGTTKETKELSSLAVPIRHLKDYQSYSKMVHILRKIAKDEGMTLFELEKYWQPKSARRRRA